MMLQLARLCMSLLALHCCLQLTVADESQKTRGKKARGWRFQQVGGMTKVSVLYVS